MAGFQTFYRVRISAFANRRDFVAVACAHDLEGIVAKPANGRYHSDDTNTNWVKIKNPSYTQMTARHELFEPRRGRKPTHTKAAVLTL